MQCTLAGLVEDHVDDLTVELAPSEDVGTPIVEECGAGDDDDGINDGDSVSP